MRIPVRPNDSYRCLRRHLALAASTADTSIPPDALLHNGDRDILVHCGYVALCSAAIVLQGYREAPSDSIDVSTLDMRRVSGACEIDKS